MYIQLHLQTTFHPIFSFVTQYVSVFHHLYFREFLTHRIIRILLHQKYLRNLLHFIIIQVFHFYYFQCQILSLLKLKVNHSNFCSEHPQLLSQRRTYFMSLLHIEQDDD